MNALALHTVSERKIELLLCGLVYPQAVWGEIHETCFVLCSYSGTVESTTGKMVVALAIKDSWSKHYVFLQHKLMSGCAIVATKFTQNSILTGPTEV